MMSRAGAEHERRLECTVKVVNDEDGPIVQVTADGVVIFNNNQGRDMLTGAITMLAAAVDTCLPDLIKGTAKVEETIHLDD